jgi:hypothetical protein
MLHGHLPILISRLGAIVRHVAHLYHDASRMVELGFYTIQNGHRPKKLQRRWASRKQRRPAQPARSCLIHYHIFKNAGSSFEWALKKVFGKAIHSYDPPATDAVFSTAQIARYVLGHPQARGVVTHQAVLPAPQLRGCRIISSILLRDPLARVRSIYVFERQQNAPSAGARRAKELDFKGYVEWRLSCSAGVFCNYQTFFCSRTLDSLPGEIITEAHLELAIQNLDHVQIVGTVERYGQWLALSQSILEESFPNIRLVVARRNVTNQAAEITHASILGGLVRDLGPELAETLLRCNQFDMRLHQVADALLTRRLAERRVDVDLLNAYAAASRSLIPPVAQTPSVVG